MTITKSHFGTLPDGSPVSMWTLVNDRGLQFQVLDYGVIIRSIVVPDQRGNPVDVVLGFDTLEEYVADRGYLGATIGRCANRIKGASFELNGTTYPLSTTFGPFHLHGGKVGFNKRLWDSRQTRDAVVFSRLSPHGEEGYPGNLRVSVTMGWKGDSLTIDYEATTDQDTVVNLTNHSYFNLNGAGNGNVHHHRLQINADQYTLTGSDGFPTGEMASVASTAMDFRTAKTIGKNLKIFGGYDHNFVLNGHPVAITVADQTGITMITDTDQPGMQLYTAPAMMGRRGKDGKKYAHHGAFCLETQHHPDSIHHPQWPTCVLKAGETFHSFTSYTFR